MREIDMTKINPHFSWMLYGPSGAGKTYAVSTAPQPIGMINTTPGGYNTLIGMDLDIRVIDLCDNTTTFEQIASLFHDIHTRTKWPECKTIVLDDWTGLMRVMLNYAMTMMRYPGGAKIQVGSLGEPQRSHYAGEASKCREFLSQFVSTPDCHRIVCFHDKVERDKEGAITSRIPFCRGDQRGNDLTGLFDEVYYLTTKQRVIKKGGKPHVVIEREFLLDPVGLIATAKSRMRGLAPDYFKSTIPADLTAALQAIKE